MRLSSLKMPGWWQACWRRRYPMGPDGVVHLVVPRPVRGASSFTIRPMGCGCGYTIKRLGNIDSADLGHTPTLGWAIRRARKYAAQEPEWRE